MTGQERPPDDRARESEVTIRLPAELAESIDRYASSRGLTIEEVIAEWTSRHCGAPSSCCPINRVLDRLTRLEQRVFDPWE